MNFINIKDEVDFKQLLRSKCNLTFDGRASGIYVDAHRATHRAAHRAVDDHSCKPMTESSYITVKKIIYLLAQKNTLNNDSPILENEIITLMDNLLNNGHIKQETHKILMLENFPNRLK